MNTVRKAVERVSYCCASTGCIIHVAIEQEVGDKMPDWFDDLREQAMVCLAGNGPNKIDAPGMPWHEGLVTEIFRETER